MFAVCLVAVFAPAGDAAASPDNCPAYSAGEKVTIARVDDGDTVRLGDGRRVRLLGVNAPELARDGQEDQPYARDARKAVKSFFAESRSARLLLDAERRDKYGRTLAHLFDHRGNSLAAYLLRSGLAWHVAVPPNLRLADCLAEQEQSARSAALGIWSADGMAPVPSDEIRRSGYQRVRGRVLRVQFGKAWWINLDGKLSGVIYAEHQHRFDPVKLRQLEGVRVELQGWVYPSRSKKYQPWRMKIETPYALERL